MIKRDFCQLPGQKKPKTSYDIESKTPNPLTLFFLLYGLYTKYFSLIPIQLTGLLRVPEILLIY